MRSSIRSESNNSVNVIIGLPLRPRPPLKCERTQLPVLDSALKFPKLYFEFVERCSGVLDVGQRERSMLFLPAPCDARSNRDRVCVNVELPPTPMRKQVAVAAKWDRTLEVGHDGLRFR